MTFEHLSQEELKHLSQEEVYNFLHLLIDRNLEVGTKLEPFYNLFKSLIDARKQVSKLEHQSKLVSPGEAELQNLREEVRFLKSLDSPGAIQQEYIGNLEEAQTVLFAAEQALVDTGHSSNKSLPNTIREMAAEIDAQDVIIDINRAAESDRDVAQRRETEELNGKLQSEGYALLAAHETIDEHLTEINRLRKGMLSSNPDEALVPMTASIYYGLPAHDVIEELQEFITSAGITVNFFVSVMQNNKLWSKTHQRELQTFLDKLKSLPGIEDHQIKIS